MLFTPDGGEHLAKPNYAFAKRQRDLAKKQKREVKRQRKAESTPSAEGAEVPVQLEKGVSEPGVIDDA